MSETSIITTTTSLKIKEEIITATSDVVVETNVDTKIENDGWYSMAVTKTELNLNITLQCGQSFRWKETTPGVWIGVIGKSIVTLKQSDDTLFYRFYPHKKQEDAKSVLEDYFQLNITLCSLYEQWGSTEHSINKDFKKSAWGLRGLRLIRQDPLECLFSFICSSNNNIARITKMVESLCSGFGTLIGEISGNKYHAFPTLNQLTNAKEEMLRESGFGYRAKYIAHTTQQLLGYPDGWLESLRKCSKQEVSQHLTSLMGVGQKVADCVSLFSLDKLDTVPVDTHMWSVAQRHMAQLRSKSLSPRYYQMVGDFFRDRFGTHAGWAHTVLFAAELPLFQRYMINIANIENNTTTSTGTDNNIDIVIKVKDEGEIPQKPSKKRQKRK